MTKQKVTVQQAADVLGTSVDAVRQRIKRGKLPRAEADDPADNRVYVWLDVNQPDSRHQIEDEASANGDVLVESLQDQVRYLRDQLSEERRANLENRRLLAAALERIPAIEAPREDAPQSPPSPGPTPTPPDAGEGPQTATERPEERRGFWSRLFG